MTSMMGTARRVQAVTEWRAVALFHPLIMRRVHMHAQEEAALNAHKDDPQRTGP